MIRDAAALPSPARKLHLGERLRSIVGCEIVIFMEFPHAPTAGTRALALQSIGLDATVDRQCRTLYSSTEGTSIDPASRMLARRMGEGPFSVADRRDLVNDEDWYQSSYVDTYRRAWCWDHSIYSASRRSDGSVLAMCFGRAWGGEPFDEVATTLASLFHSECTWLLQAEMQTTAKIRESLAPRCRETLDEILGGASTKEIAAKLGLSVHTVRDYEKRLHTAFGVHSRTELFARVLAH